MELSKFPPQYADIVELLRPFQVYLVGGAVRDMLLDKPFHDLDFTLPEGTIPAGKLIADRLEGDFFVLDQERETTRVILDNQGPSRLVVDFTLMQGKNIEQDLAARDFTITSMAIKPGSERDLIDPWGGAEDIRQGLIRATSEGALRDDPLRCVRAVRLAAQLNFAILPQTKAQIQRCRSDLAGISSERIRDELFRILAGPGQAAALLALRNLGLYNYVLPGELTEKNTRTVRQLASIWTLFTEEHDQNRSGNWHSGLLVHRLGRYREQIRSYLLEEPVPGRSIYQLSLLLPLISGSGHQAPDSPLKSDLNGLSLGNSEVELLEKAVQARNAFLDRADGPAFPSPLDVYRYFRQSGRAGVAGIFLGLAEEFGKLGPEREAWIGLLDAARTLLEGYWDRAQDWVDPEPLLDGNQLLEHFELPPGPLIGTLLETLREEQVRRGLKSREEAINFLEDKISQQAGPAHE